MYVLDCAGAVGVHFWESNTEEFVILMLMFMLHATSKPCQHGWQGAYSPTVWMWDCAWLATWM